MRSREFIKEADVPIDTSQNSTQLNPTANAQQDNTITKLTASIADLQKQIKNLQKASLQQITQQPKPGEASQSQASVKPVGPGQGDGQVAPSTQQAQQQTQPATAPQPALTKQTIGQPPAPQPKPTISPGVNQPPAVSKMNLQRDLVKNIAGGK